jgi:4-hydroxythreonine-4-phosphate dehydrogenase
MGTNSDVIGITIGDVAGIGPEIVVKALASGRLPPNYQYTVIGSGAILDRVCRALGVRPTCELIEVGKYELTDIQPGQPDKRAAKAAADWLAHGIKLARAKKIVGLVTAPLNKASLHKAGIKVPGQTELLGKFTHSKHVAMMLVGQFPKPPTVPGGMAQTGWLRVTLATTHVAMKEVSRALTRSKVLDAIELTHEWLPKFGIQRRRIGVADRKSVV